MKRLAAGLVVVAFASTICAQQPRPQVQKIAPAGPTMDEVLSAQGAPAPLTGKRRLEVYGKALATPRSLDTGELGSAVRITPRNLYVNASTYAWVKQSTVAPEEGATGVSQIFPREAGRGDQPMLRLHFRAAAGKQYIVDCTIVGEGVRSIKVNRTAINTVEGHLVVAVPSTAQARDVVLELTSDRAFQWTACEIVPVNR